MKSRLWSAAKWITVRRLYAHGILLAVCLWSAAAFDFSTSGLLDRAGNVKCQDLLPLYVSGLLIHEGRSDQLFNSEVFSRELHATAPVPSGVQLPFLYGPQVALAFAPFSRLSFSEAAWLWVAVTMLLYLACCYAIWKTCLNLRAYRKLVVILAIAFPPFFHFVLRGQISSLVLACFVAAFLAFRGGHKFFAGAALGLLIFKPQFVMALPLIFLASGDWKSFAGSLAGASIELGCTWWYFGSSVMRAYFKMVMEIPQKLALAEPGPSAAQMHSLRSFWGLLVPSPGLSFALYVASSAAVLSVAALCWRSGKPLPLRFSVVALAAVLVNPHLFVYDLVVLAVPLLLVADWSVGSASNLWAGKTGVLLYLMFILPLLGPLTLWTHLQLSVPIFVAMEWILFEILCRADGVWQKLPASAI
jgi:arabinofuranan 3-O-arabinosyltransferase